MTNQGSWLTFGTASQRVQKKRKNTRSRKGGRAAEVSKRKLRERLEGRPSKLDFLSDWMTFQQEQIRLMGYELPGGWKHDDVFLAYYNSLRACRHNLAGHKPWLPLGSRHVEARGWGVESVMAFHGIVTRWQLQSVAR